MIAARHLSRSFDRIPAVEDVSFKVPSGRLCALLGPNGAGKTTIVRMLLGLLPPSSGSGEVAGIQLPSSRDQATSLRARAGLLTETPGFYDRLSGAENLDFFGRLYGVPESDLLPRTQAWLRRLGLWEARDRPFGTYSKGMKQRLALIRAVFHEPVVIFLDEPTAGLDPAASREVRSLIGELRREGRTILLCTHHLGEAEELADLVGILQRRLIAFGSQEDLTGSAMKVAIRLRGDLARLQGVVASLPGVRGVTIEDDTMEVDTEDVPAVTPVVVASLVAAGGAVLEVRPVRTSLETIYLRAVASAA
jgi:ABC-2 type transport system ATP-binding protein